MSPKKIFHSKITCFLYEHKKDYQVGSEMKELIGKPPQNYMYQVYLKRFLPHFDDDDRSDLKLIVQGLEELRASFNIFRPLRNLKLALDCQEFRSPIQMIKRRTYQKVLLKLAF